MLKTNSLFPQFPGTFHRRLLGLWRICKKSRLLSIASLVAAGPLVFALCGMIYISYNRTDLPDLDAFLRFEPPTMGRIYDANGHVLIELGSERREIIQFKNIPDVLRQAILSAEDENFFSHSGVDYSVFPRLLSALVLNYGDVLEGRQAAGANRLFSIFARRVARSLRVKVH